MTLARVWTVGHSTRSLGELLEILAARGVTGIADARRFPASRRTPAWSREALERDLPAAGVAYAWIPELGGRRSPRRGSPHTAWRVAGFAGYADHMDTPEWAAGLRALLDHAARRPTAVMCAEALYTRCHRRLIADALVARGLEGVHLIDARRAEIHRLPPFARRVGDRLVYDGGDPPAPDVRR